MESIFNFIDAKSNEYTDFLRDICTFEATARDKEELDKMVDYIECFAKNKGFSAKRTTMEKCGDFLTVDINEGAQRGSVFLAHMDTVHKKGAFGYPCVTVKDGRMTAPGAIDCKGGIAIALLAMEALKQAECKEHIRLILTSDEEISNVLGGEEEQEFIRNSVNGFKSALNCETTCENEVIISRKGIIRKEITVNGVGGHSGIDYFKSSSAIREAAYKIIELEKHSVSGGATFNCSVINGGSTPNCIPDSCIFTVDIRVVTFDDIEKAENVVTEIVNKSFVSGTVSTARDISRRPPMERNEDTERVFNSLNEVSIKYGLGELVARRSGGGSDSAYTQMAGIPSVCGMGGEGEFCHTNEEYIELSSIPKRAKLLAAFCIEGEF